MTEPELADSPSKAARVLIVEDNPLNQRILSLMLNHHGYDVDIVGNGRLAVEAVEGNPYDIVLMDIQMPEMDGLEATRAIRSNPRFAELPIVAVTAFLKEVGKDNCFRMGMNDYVEKPFRKQHILDVVQKWLTR